jgi:hypothetical protein
MTNGNPGMISTAVVRTLAEFAALPLAEERLATIGDAVQETLARRAAFDALDLSSYEPAWTFDASWQ